MRLTISTSVQQSIQQVWAGFNQTLFGKLSPPFPPVRVVRFDGSQIGDEVHLELNFLLFKQNWISEIIDQKTTKYEIYFIDEGTRLPFFLSYWHHKHRLVSTEAGSKIIDEITFRTPSILTDYLFFPLLYFQFLYRKPIYRKTFS